MRWAETVCGGGASLQVSYSPVAAVFKQASAAREKRRHQLTRHPHFQNNILAKGLSRAAKAGPGGGILFVLLKLDSLEIERAHKGQGSQHTPCSVPGSQPPSKSE